MMSYYIFCNKILLRVFFTKLTTVDHALRISLLELELLIFRRKFLPRDRDQHDQMLEADKLEFTRRYKKLMLTLINAPTPDWPFIESFPTLGGSTGVVGPPPARADNS